MCLFRNVLGGAFEVRSMGWQLGRLVGIVGVVVVRFALWLSCLRAASNVARVGEGEDCFDCTSFALWMCNGESWMVSRWMIGRAYWVGELDVIDEARLAVRSSFLSCVLRDLARVREGEDCFDCASSASWRYDGDS